MKWIYTLGIVFCVMILVASSVLAQETTPPDSLLFKSAILDAQNPEPDEIYKKLTPIVGNDSLIDTLINDEKHVLVVSWKNTIKDYPPTGLYNTGKWDIWVTVAPQLQEKCISYFKTEADPVMRLRQLLGLQPMTKETFFLELWVRPKDLFRPCPDNETSDQVCGLNLPKNVTPAYRTWFNNTRAVQYTDCADSLYHEAGYPWTQLGYTYDWSPNNQDHVGLSEFVVKRDVKVWVRGKYLTTVYCN